MSRSYGVLHPVGYLHTVRASAEVVSQIPGDARMQVSGRFCTLTSPSVIASEAAIWGRSQSHPFPQVTRPGFWEPGAPALEGRAPLRPARQRRGR